MMRRLFTTFAPGAPGIGLLLLRAACASILISYATSMPWNTLAVPELLLRITSTGLALLLLAGLWTPVAATLAAADSFLIALSHPVYARYWLIAVVVCAALALLGPGAWSIDARLFGWKRIEIEPQRR
jgi:uncharacterized membrane protein YphA (DoxX/SURF4 family)